jgi:hypothetical protein
MVTRTLAWLGQVIDVGFVGGTVANNYYCETAPSVLPVSRFDFSGQLREEGDIAVKFLRQTTDYCLGRHHLAVDHLKHLRAIDEHRKAIGRHRRGIQAHLNSMLDFDEDDDTEDPGLCEDDDDDKAFVAELKQLAEQAAALTGA